MMKGYRRTLGTNGMTRIWINEAIIGGTHSIDMVPFSVEVHLPNITRLFPHVYMTYAGVS